jgi:hypothetical protein
MDELISEKQRVTAVLLAPMGVAILAEKRT